MPSTATPTTANVPATARSFADRVRDAAAVVDAHTPADRDRVMDLLRVASMFVVALGHWSMAMVWVELDGSLATASLLVEAPWTHWATLALQVMGLFFAVGGWASARSLRTPPASTTTWVHARVRRLLVPVTVYVAAVALLVPVVAGTVGPEVATVARQAFTIHLWFCAAVVPLYLLTPALLAGWRAWGLRLLVALTGAALLVDVGHRVLALPLVGWANFVFVWGAATVVGFAWADGLVDRTVARRMVVGGTAAVAALVATPWIGLAMVGVDGSTVNNTYPPSVVLVALTVAHVGTAVLVRPWLQQLTARPLVWAGIALAGRGAVTVYLWHLLGMGLFVVAAHAVVPGLLAVEPLGATWWWTRPLWLAALAVATVPLVALALRFELRPTTTAAPGPARVVLASSLATWGCLVLVFRGVGALHGVAAVLVAAVVGRWVPATAARRPPPARRT